MIVLSWSVSNGLIREEGADADKAARQRITDQLHDEHVNVVSLLVRAEKGLGSRAWSHDWYSSPHLTVLEPVGCINLHQLPRLGPIFILSRECADKGSSRQIWRNSQGSQDTQAWLEITGFSRGNPSPHVFNDHS